MLKTPSPRQHTLEMVILDDLVPADHLLRNVDKYIDFEFIRDKVRHLYCDNNGRPAGDPVLLFKMLFIGYLFGVRSERQLAVKFKSTPPFCGCETMTWPSLCALSRVAPCEWPVFIGGGQPEYEEDCAAAGAAF